MHSTGIKESTNREKVLKSIRDALINKTDTTFRDINFNSNVFEVFNDEPDIIFAQEFTELGGKFVYCADEKELSSYLKALSVSENWQDVYTQDDKIRSYCIEGDVEILSESADITESNVAISFCDFLIARFGAIMISSGLNSGRKIIGYPEVHVVIAFASQLEIELKDALSKLLEKYNGKLPSFVSTISGPSRTADIEKTLIMGAHGPKELYLFFVDDL